jgi:hypothetical protein
LVTDSEPGATDVAPAAAVAPSEPSVVTAPARPSAPAASASAAKPANLPWAGLFALKLPQTMTADDPATTAVVVALALTTMIHIGVVLTVSALNPAPPSPSTATPTLHLNRLDFVPGSAKEITSFYSRWTYLPGAPGLIQGTQQFDVVDSKTVEKIGTFDALVSKATGLDYTALMVTSNDGVDVGTGVGQIPPVGSIISHLKLGLIGFSYSAMPTPSGDVVSFVINTPSGDIPLTLKFDAAAGIADRTIDNRPIGLGDGFTMAPADPAGESFTAISGVLPLFTTVQGRQVFNIYDSAGQSVGSFDGVFTTTSDIIGTYTQAVMVTGNDGTNVGTAPGQIPPVGSVYNVIYEGSDAHYFLYSSLPSPSGDKVSMIEVNEGKVTNSALTLIDASAQPASKPLVAGGYRFTPVSALSPSGINGLPPRDVQIQGYQQFDVYNSDGSRIGSVDADVSAQWDGFGIHSQALLVTKVTDGIADEMPPVGSVFNFVSSGDKGFGSAHSVMPLASGDLTTFTLTTPWGDIPLPSTHLPATLRTAVTFFNPFVSV